MHAYKGSHYINRPDPALDRFGPSQQKIKEETDEKDCEPDFVLLERLEQ